MEGRLRMCINAIVCAFAPSRLRPASWSVAVRCFEAWAGGRISKLLAATNSARGNLP